MDKFDEMINCVSGNHSFVQTFIDVVNDSRQKEKEWIVELRRKGFKAAHPNDGWIDRKNNKLHFAYPQFNDNAKVGDLVMLGWHFDDKNLRPVKLIKEESGLLQYFYFEDVSF